MTDGIDTVYIKFIPLKVTTEVSSRIKGLFDAGFLIVEIISDKTKP